MEYHYELKTFSSKSKVYLISESVNWPFLHLQYFTGLNILESRAVKFLHDQTYTIQNKPCFIAIDLLSFPEFVLLFYIKKVVKNKTFENFDY